MTTHSLREPIKVGIFDIETELDEAAAAAAGYKGSRIRSALQKVSTACLLTANEGPDGAWGDFELVTLTAALSEFDLLMKLDRAFANLTVPGATLATYNGRKHDLNVIRRRAARYWMFGLPGLTAMAQMHHVDIMLRQAPGRIDQTPTLREACAGLGISAYETRKAGDRQLASEVAKCQIDVVATFLLFLYEAAIERSSPDVLLAGWTGLSDYIGGLRPRPMHLEHFRNHPILRAAKIS